MSTTILARAREALSGTTVDPNVFFSLLAKHFGYESIDNITDGDLKYAKWEDLEECGLPKGKARQVADIFRSSEPDPIPSVPQTITVVSDDPEVIAKSMSPLELIEKAVLDSKRCPYATQLDELAENRRFIIYQADGKVNVEETFKLFELLEDYGDSENAIIDGAPQPVYYVGDRPAKVLNEHPLYPGRALRPDDPINQVHIRVQQLWRVGVELGSLDPKEYHEVDLVDAGTYRGYEYFALKYQDAAVELQNREKVGNAPKLKVTVTSTRDNEQITTNNPFGIGQNRTT